MSFDLYSELQLPRDATPLEVCKAYRRLALENHPDKNPEPEAKERFHKISIAYTILSVPADRERYDAKIRHREEAVRRELLRQQEAAQKEASQKSCRHQCPIKFIAGVFQPKKRGCVGRETSDSSVEGKEAKEMSFHSAMEEEDHSFLVSGEAGRCGDGKRLSRQTTETEMDEDEGFFFAAHDAQAVFLQFFRDGDPFDDLDERWRSFVSAQLRGPPVRGEGEEFDSCLSPSASHCHVASGCEPSSCASTSVHEHSDAPTTPHDAVAGRQGGRSFAGSSVSGGACGSFRGAGSGVCGGEEDRDAPASVSDKVSTDGGCSERGGAAAQHSPSNSNSSCPTTVYHHQSLTFMAAGRVLNVGPQTAFAAAARAHGMEGGSAGRKCFLPKQQDKVCKLFNKFADCLAAQPLPRSARPVLEPIQQQQHQACHGRITEDWLQGCQQQKQQQQQQQQPCHPQQHQQQGGSVPAASSSARRPGSGAPTPPGRLFHDSGTAIALTDKYLKELRDTWRQAAEKHYPPRPRSAGIPSASPSPSPSPSPPPSGGCPTPAPTPKSVRGVWPPCPPRGDSSNSVMENLREVLSRVNTVQRTSQAQEAPSRLGSSRAQTEFRGPSPSPTEPCDQAAFTEMDSGASVLQPFLSADSSCSFQSQKERLESVIHLNNAVQGRDTSPTIERESEGLRPLVGMRADGGGSSASSASSSSSASSASSDGHPPICSPSLPSVRHCSSLPLGPLRFPPPTAGCPPSETATESLESFLDLHNHHSGSGGKGGGGGGGNKESFSGASGGACSSSLLNPDCLASSPCITPMQLVGRRGGKGAKENSKTGPPRNGSQCSRPSLNTEIGGSAGTAAEARRRRCGGFQRVPSNPSHSRSRSPDALTHGYPSASSSSSASFTLSVNPYSSSPVSAPGRSVSCRGDGVKVEGAGLRSDSETLSLPGNGLVRGGVALPPADFSPPLSPPALPSDDIPCGPPILPPSSASSSSNPLGMGMGMFRSSAARSSSCLPVAVGVGGGAPETTSICYRMRWDLHNQHNQHGRAAEECDEEDECPTDDTRRREGSISLLEGSPVSGGVGASSRPYTLVGDGDATPRGWNLVLHNCQCACARCACSPTCQGASSPSGPRQPVRERETKGHSQSSRFSSGGSKRGHPSSRENSDVECRCPFVQPSAAAAAAAAAARRGPPSSTALAGEMIAGLTRKTSPAREGGGPFRRLFGPKRKGAQAATVPSTGAPVAPSAYASSPTQSGQAVRGNDAAQRERERVESDSSSTYSEDDFPEPPPLNRHGPLGLRPLPDQCLIKQQEELPTCPLNSGYGIRHMAPVAAYPNTSSASSQRRRSDSNIQGSSSRHADLQEKGKSRRGVSNS